MKNVQKWQLKNCIFMETDTFDTIIKELFGKEYTVDFSLDGLSIYQNDGEDYKDLDTDTLYKTLAAYFDVAEVTSIHCDDCDEIGVWICYIPCPQYLILSNNADVQDLSVYVAEGDEDEVFKKMQASILVTASHAGNQNVASVKCLKGTREGDIVYTDDNTECFRYLSLDSVTPIDEADGIAESNLDAIPDELSFDYEACQYALFDEGRE